MLVLLLVCISFANAAKILAIIPTPSVSHNIVTQPLWKELSLRGHQVTTFTTDPINDPKLINLTEIDVSFSYKIFQENLQEIIYDSFMESYARTYTTLARCCDKQLEHPIFQNIIKNESESFDLVIVEPTRPVFLALAHKFNCPSIGITCLETTVMMYHAMGNPTHPIFYPEYWLHFGDTPTLINRLTGVLYDTFINVFYRVRLLPLYQEIMEKHFGKGYPPITNLMENLSLHFVHTNPIFHKIRPLVPGIIQIGGNLHRLPFEPLSGELKTILDNSVKGFIYFSLGTNVKSKSLPPEIRDAILGTFAELPYTVLWKFEDENLPNKTQNVIILNFFPQLQVLNHPNIKLFVTHGGLQSVTEAIHAHVPIIGLPFFADQPQNIQEVASKGFGVYLNYYELTKDKFKATILEVINNPRYRQRVKEISDLVNDQPMTGLERSVWWIEYVLRHKGAKHLRSPLIDIPFINITY